jgi:hypothetical protein
MTELIVNAVILALIGLSFLSLMGRVVMFILVIVVAFYR